MIIDDLKVLHGVSFLPRAEVNLRLRLSCSLGVNGEMGGRGHLNTCTVTDNQIYVHFHSYLVSVSGPPCILCTPSDPLCFPFPLYGHCFLFSLTR